MTEKLSATEGMPRLGRQHLTEISQRRREFEGAPKWDEALAAPHLARLKDIETIVTALQPGGTHSLIPNEDLLRLEEIRLAAVGMIDWINGPNSEDLFSAVAKASGVHAGHVRALAAAFGRRNFDWADDDNWPNSYEYRWLSPTTPADTGDKP